MPLNASLPRTWGCPLLIQLSRGEVTVVTRELIGTGEHRVQLPCMAWGRLASGCHALFLPSLWLSALELQAPEKSFLGGWAATAKLLCGCFSVVASNTGHTTPQLCPQPLPGFLPSCLESILLICSQELSCSQHGCTLHWPNHVFGEGSARDLAQAFSLLFGGSRVRGNSLPQGATPCPYPRQSAGGLL